jgi:hypothetical protein
LLDRRLRNDVNCRRRVLCGVLGILALEDGADGIAGLRDLREVKLRLRLDGWLGAGSGAASAVEVVAHTIGLVWVDGTGVGLPRDAEGFERVEDWPAFYFQFPCKIVDSNFDHPSLFASSIVQLFMFSLLKLSVSTLLSLKSQVSRLNECFGVRSRPYQPHGLATVVSVLIDAFVGDFLGLVDEFID